LILEADIPDRGEHLAAYHRVDIALDTFPYNGVTTSAEALWMGVPVLTLAGERFLSRQGLGLLMNAGLPDWVASDPDDYVAKAVQGAANLPELARLRARMRDRLRASASFDAPRFARHFADALWLMWRRHEDG
jgi:predicted O-linked N-acetylglucosamine transferase (SPINDLY family)